MTLTRVAIGALVGALACAPCAAAQDTTVEQLVATALERAPDIRAARTAIAAAGGQLTQAGLRHNPVVTTSETVGVRDATRKGRRKAARSRRFSRTST